MESTYKCAHKTIGTQPPLVFRSQQSPSPLTLLKCVTFLGKFIVSNIKGLRSTIPGCKDIYFVTSNQFFFNFKDPGIPLDVYYQHLSIVPDVVLELPSDSDSSRFNLYLKGLETEFCNVAGLINNEIQN